MQFQSSPLSRPAQLALAALALAGSSFGQATQQGSTLTILGSQGGDVLSIRFLQVAGEVEVFGVPGTPEGTLFTGVTKLDLKTLAGTDIVDLQILSATVPELLVDTGVGESQVGVLFNVPSSLALVSSVATITGGPDKDTVLLDITTASANVALNWAVAAGDGPNETNVKYSTNVGGGSSLLNWRYTGGAQEDKVLLDIVSAADSIGVGALVNTGASNDEFLVKVSGDSNTVAALSVLGRLGAGGDTALVDVTNVGQTIVRGGIDAGEGNDTLEYITSSSLRGSPVLYGAGDNDTLKFTVNGSLLAGSQPRIIAGDGNDDVSMLVWGSLLGSPFSDGGAGFDYFRGVGTRINFEEIN